MQDTDGVKQEKTIHLKGKLKGKLEVGHIENRNRHLE